MNKRTNNPRKKTYSKAAINWGNGKPDVVHRGITWREFPGSDSAEKRINFTLFRRGRHPLNRRCEGLEGAALVARLSALVEIQRVNGRKGGGGWKLKRRAEAQREAQGGAAAAAPSAGAPAAASSSPSLETEAPQAHAAVEGEGRRPAQGLRPGSASHPAPGAGGAASGVRPGVGNATRAPGAGGAIPGATPGAGGAASPAATPGAGHAAPTPGMGGAVSSATAAMGRTAPAPGMGETGHPGGGGRTAHAPGPARPR